MLLTGMADGGGVRGYSMLIILQDLMHRVFVETENRAPKREEVPKPCDHFDLIAGTGTGGLIAIMLGRLRLDLETCMDVYVRMTRRVFETDKTIAGIPYKSTLFKASKLEEAIQQCVREHTIFEDEGNDGTAAGGREFGGMSPVSPNNPRRSTSLRSQTTLQSPRTSRPDSLISPGLNNQWGNPNASLYDGRENRTKTAVTAVFEKTPMNGNSVLLRSYDSRREPAVSPEITIWQAGRATSATGLAFKPIKVQLHTFHDEGAGKYNPSPQILEEAAVNEWPGREVGIFVSIGTGKRPGGSSTSGHEWWEGFVGSSVGNFAEARRKLIGKIEGCQDTHIDMLNVQLAKRGVPRENYCRLNVEVGVGEFGMNEWDRLSEMSTGTRRYLDKSDVKEMARDAAAKMAKIELTKRRLEAHSQGRQHSRVEVSRPDAGYGELASAPVKPPHAFAVELPGNDMPAERLPVRNHSPPYSRGPSSSGSGPPYPHTNAGSSSMGSSSQDKFVVAPPEASSPRTSAELSYQPGDDYAYTSQSHVSSMTSPSRDDNYIPTPTSAPPRPPKTPINDYTRPVSYPVARPQANTRLPYPDTDGPPPMVNKMRKPEFSAR